MSETSGRPFLLTWNNIIVLVVILIISHGITITYSMCIFWGASHTYSEVGQFIDMISTSSDGTILSVLLILSGCICLPYNVFGIILIMSSLKRVKNEKLNKLLYVYVLMAIFVLLTLVCVAIAAVAHSYGMHERIEDGIIDAMREYAVRSDMKLKIDKMQVKFQCCGSKIYKEWFELQWFDSMLGGAEKPNSNTFVADNTPFSCCSMTALAPCIHHHIINRSSFFQYDNEKKLSISTRGCHGVMMHETRVVGWVVLVTVLGLSILECLICLGTRIIQTAHSELFYFERGPFLHSAWILRNEDRKLRSQLTPRTPPPPPPPWDWE